MQSSAFNSITIFVPIIKRDSFKANQHYLKLIRTSCSSSYSDICYVCWYTNMLVDSINLLLNS